MTPEEQRIAIAEACGLKPPFKIEHQGKWRAKPFTWTIPDYLNDLNAMHEAEKVLKDSKRLNAYYGYLWNICGRQEEYVRATAAQRAEAFLRILGKWKE